MSNHLITERDYDEALVQIQADAQEEYEKWLAEFKGPRMARHPAQHAGAVPQNAPVAQPEQGSNYQ